VDTKVAVNSPTFPTTGTLAHIVLNPTRMTDFTDETLTFEVREYPDKLSDKIIIWFIIIILCFGLLMAFIEISPEKIITRFCILIGIFLLIVRYLVLFFFKRPNILGRIVINYETIDINETKINSFDIEYISVRLNDYRGKFSFSRNVYPLPSLGINNEIIVRLKTGQTLETNFYIARKKDRKKIDRYIHYWCDKNIMIDYFIEKEKIV
jgi:hypothetical protein